MAFDGVEVGPHPGRRSTLSHAPLLGEVRGHGGALEGRELIPEEHHGVTEEVALEGLDRGDQIGRGEGPGPGHRVASAPAPNPPECHDRVHREALHVEGVGQDRSLPPRGPSAADGRPLGRPALGAKEVPDVARVVGFTGHVLDHGGDPRQGPHLGGKAARPRALAHPGVHGGPLGAGELRFAARPPGGSAGRARSTPDASASRSAG